MNWKKYIIVSISAIAILISAKYLYACIFSPVYYTYPSFFGNKAPEKPVYRPFFYVEGDFYYDNDEDKNQDSIDFLNNTNIKEWQNYSDKNISLGDIDSVVNSFSIKKLKEIVLSKKYQNNSFAKWLTNKKAASDYLIYAKQCEPYAIQENDWDTLKTNKDSSEILMNKGLQALQNEQDDFLKMRYTFQVLRLAFYNKEYDKTLELYNKLIGDKWFNSLSFARCVGFKAGVFYKRKNYGHAAYLYSKMFDASDGLKKMAMISFLWSLNNSDSIKDVAASALNLCTNNREKAIIIIMQALRNFDNGLSMIKQAYSYDPKVQGIDVLMNREINKVEERYQSMLIDADNNIEYYPEYGLWDYYDASDKSKIDIQDSIKNYYANYLKELSDFTHQIISDNKNGRAAFWHLSLAYMAYMQNNVTQMNNEMQLANAAQMNVSEERLYHTIEILYIIKNHKTITPELENELLPKLQALDQLANINSDDDDNFSNIMSLLLAPKYLKQKDTAKAIYCLAHSDRRNVEYVYDNSGNWHRRQIPTTFYVDNSYEDRPGTILNEMSIESLHGLQSFQSKQNKTAFESWLVANTYYDKNVLAELEGTKYLRVCDFKAAEKIFKNIKKLDSLPYPFEMRIADSYDTVYRQDATINTNKYTFSKQMASLQDTIANNPNNAPALYKYALGLYGMSYYGRSADLFTYYRHTTDEYAYYKTEDRDKLPNEYQEFYGLYEAEKYFNLAAKAATTATLKARCLFGAAKCWQKRCPQREDNDYEDSTYVAYSLINPYFKILKQNYSDNEFTKVLYRNCDYYKDYVKRNR